MPSKKSIKTAFNNFADWSRQNPKASVGTAIKQIGHYGKEGLELRISVGTLPSLFMPVPKSMADKIDDIVRRMKRR